MSLGDIIKKEIQAKGPLSLSHYMDLCLYHPQMGYYMPKNPLGRSGDFVTAPEISSLFGETIAISLESLCREKGYDAVSLVELGGGSGLLMKDMARTFQILKRQISSYHMVEISPVLKAHQQETLRDFPVSWTESLPSSITGPVLIVANEFFDAFPIDQYIFTNEGWRERCIDRKENGEVYWSTQPTSFSPPDGWPTPTIGDIFEDPRLINAYFQSILDCLKSHGGIFLTVDYGHDQRTYGDTFQALRRHVRADPLSGFGTSDLTTHVNFKILFDKARAFGMEPLPLLTQGAFLKHYGIEERIKIPPHRDVPNILKAVQKLTHPQEMGSLFKVMTIVH
jgi:NADH dehydrogenase [ubiquinone] 1 alpha subcomplex assembly factor 7